MFIQKATWIATLLAAMAGSSAGWIRAEEDRPKEEPRAEKARNREPDDQPRREEGRPPQGERRREGGQPGSGPRPEGGPRRDGDSPRPGPRPEGGPGRDGERSEGDRGPNGREPGRGPEGEGPRRGFGAPEQGLRGPGFPSRFGQGSRPGQPGQGMPNPGMVSGGPRRGNPSGSNPDDFGERDPEMLRLTQMDQELDRKSHELSEQIRRNRGAGGEQKEQLKKELAEVVNQHFNVRQERRELELKRTEEQIERLRNSVRSHKEKRDSAVQRRIADLTGDGDSDF